MNDDLILSVQPGNVRKKHQKKKPGERDNFKATMLGKRRVYVVHEQN
jgi:hypothetical protein